MKRSVVVLIILLMSLSTVVAGENFFDNLTQAQRYDLADSYNRVADRYLELDETQKAESFRAMVQVIFPGFGSSERPTSDTQALKPVVREEPKTDPVGEDASRYYFNKLLRGIFNENVDLTLSVLADIIYLPLYDSGLNKKTVGSELGWFFDNYDLSQTAPGDVIIMKDINVTPLENAFWRLDVKLQPEYKDMFPELTFWSEKMGFYFRKFPEGWRLGAISPVA